MGTLDCSGITGTGAESSSNRCDVKRKHYFNSTTAAFFSAEAV